MFGMSHQMVAFSQVVHMCVIQVMHQLTVLEEEVHGEVPVSDHRPKGAGQLNYKRVHHSVRRPGEHNRRTISHPTGPLTPGLYCTSSLSLLPVYKSCR